jgi:hypothetical protein
MPRTTIDIDSPLLNEIKVLQKKEGRSLSRIVSELLAEGLAQRRSGHPSPRLHWISRSMQARVDLKDKEALFEAMDGDSD